MANKNTRQLKKEIARAFAEARRSGKPIQAPRSKRKSKWHGIKRAVTVIPTAL
jgi:hypothetical protein